MKGRDGRVERGRCDWESKRDGRRWEGRELSVREKGGGKEKKVREVRDRKEGGREWRRGGEG